MFYAPVVQTPHMLEEKGDIAFSGSYALAYPAGTAYTAEMDYAFSSRFNTHLLGQKFICDPYNQGGIAEFGLGYYQKLKSNFFFQSGVNYGYMWGRMKIYNFQSLRFSGHTPNLTGSLGVKGKYLFASVGLKTGIIFRDRVSRDDGNSYATNFWYDDPYFGVPAYESMKGAYHTQGTFTVGVRYKIFSLAFFYSLLTEPVTFPEKFHLPAAEASLGVKLQFTPNLLKGF